MDKIEYGCYELLAKELARARGENYDVIYDSEFESYQYIKFKVINLKKPWIDEPPIYLVKSIVFTQSSNESSSPLTHYLTFENRPMFEPW